MRFKTMRLKTIHNGSKRTIYDSEELELLQMVSKLVTRRWETLVGVGLVPLHSRRVLELRG